MENKTTKNKPKKRSNEYEPKVKFDGTFGDMIAGRFQASIQNIASTRITYNQLIAKS